MTTSVRETALQALHARLIGMSGPAVRRNEPEDTDVPTCGLINLRDGDAGDPVEVYLSPPTYVYAHRAEVAVLIQAPTAAERDAQSDAILRAIGDAIASDDTLGGTVDAAYADTPETLTDAADGGMAIKGTLVPIILEYTTDSPLG